jgi:hypothetical protein
MSMQIDTSCICPAVPVELRSNIAWSQLFNCGLVAAARPIGYRAPPSSDDSSEKSTDARHFERCPFRV